MADATAPPADPAPVAPASENSEEKQPTVTDTADEPTARSTPAMSGALQSPDADVGNAPAVTEGMP